MTAPRRSTVHQGWASQTTSPPASVPTLAANPLFAGVRDADLQVLQQALASRAIPAQGVIFQEDTPGHTMYVIAEGFVRIQTFHADGSEIVLALLGPGDVLGEMSVVDRLSRSATAIAHEPVSLLGLERETFTAMLDRIPLVSRNLNGILARRLRLSNAHLRALATLDVEGRIAHELVTFVREFGDNGGQLPFHLTQAELGSFVGASRVRVNQVMGDFRRLGLVTWNDQHRITVGDPDSLAALIHER